MKRRVSKFVSRIGVLLTVIGVAGLALGFVGIVDFVDFDYGLSAGVRMLGSLAIVGCLLSAIGFFILEDDSRQ